jgi:hypothetical protein
VATLYARLNFSPRDVSDFAETAHRLKPVFHDAAVEGYADDFEVFFLEELGVVGLAVPFEDAEPWILFEAGQVIGYVKRCIEQSKITGSGSFSYSFVDADGKLIDSTLGF